MRRFGLLSRRFRLGLSCAAFWLLFAVICFLASWRITRTHDPKVIYVPIRFDRVNKVQATFKADISGIYHVQVDLKRKLPFEDLQSITGGWTDPDKPSHVGPPRPEIVWTVNNVKPEDRLVQWRDAYWGPTVGLELGEFKATSGHQYTLTSKVVKPSSTLQILDPHLQLTLPHTVRLYYKVFAELAQLGGLVALIFSIVLVIYSGLYELRSRGTLQS